jgi:hypothetical protein
MLENILNGMNILILREFKENKILLFRFMMKINLKTTYWVFVRFLFTIFKNLKVSFKNGLF